MRAADFERLYGEHAQPLFGFLVYRTGDRALAEDLLADTFERVLRARRRFDPRKGTERAWLYTIALNRLRDHQRRSGVETRALEAAAAPGARPEGDDQLARLETRDTLQRALEVLSAQEREAVALRFGADLTLEEIARVVGEPRTTIEARVYRSLRKLREQLV